MPDGHSIVEMLIPGPKVGLVIGKGGETIRNLQVRFFKYFNVQFCVLQVNPIAKNISVPCFEFILEYVF